MQADVPVGHWKARLRRAARAREDRWYCAFAFSRPGGASGVSASWIAKAGRKENIAEEFLCAAVSSSWYSRRKRSEASSSPCCPPLSSSRASNPQYSLKNISPSSSLIFRTLTGFVPLSMRAAIASRFCMSCGSGRCTGGGRAAPLLCACAEMTWEERRMSEGGRARRNCESCIGAVL